MTHLKTVMACSWTAGLLAISSIALSSHTAIASSAAIDVAGPEEAAVQKVIREQAKALMPLVKADISFEFLRAAELLPEPPARTVYRNRDKGTAINAAAWAILNDEEKKGFVARALKPEFYYSTGYGSPLVYVRVVELLGQHGLKSLENKKILDFGAGTIGHLRTMGLAGAEAHGVDVEPLLGALYSEDGDQGKVKDGKKGEAWLHIGRWPAEPAMVKRTGSGFDAITSKNTLKEGYIHPKPPAGKSVDARQTISLGVDDATFLKQVHDSLKPGGLFVIYNICPAQSDANDLSQPYVPWADGKSPFSREQFAAAGLEVVMLDEDDSKWAIDAFTVLGYGGNASKEEMSKTTFCWYTVARRPVHGK